MRAKGEREEGVTGDHYVFGQSLSPCSSFIYLCIPMKFCTV